MNKDELNRSFEGLFSDSSPPANVAEEKQATAPRLHERVVDEGAPSLAGKGTRLELEPPAATGEPRLSGEAHGWRRGHSETLLRGSFAIGTLAVLAGSYMAYRNQDVWSIPVYVVAWALLALITFWRRLPTALRIGALLLIVYAVGLVDLLRAGKGGEVRPLLLVMPFLATLFFGRRGGIVSLIVIALTMAGFGVAFSAGFIAVPIERQASSASPLSWLSSAVILVVVGSLVAYSLDYVVRRLGEALTKNLSLSKDLEHRSGLLPQTKPLERRARQLEISAQVGRALSSILDLEQLLREAVELTRDRFGWHSVAVYLLESGGEQVRLVASAGEAGARLVTNGPELRVGETSLVGWTARHRRARVASNVVEDEVYQPLPLLTQAASEVALPLKVGPRLLGVLDIEARDVGAFDEDTVQVLQGLADQLAISILNARRVRDEAAVLEVTNPAYRASRRLAEALTVDDVLDAAMRSVSETESSGCVVGLFEPVESGERGDTGLTRTWHRHGPSPFAKDNELATYAAEAAQTGIGARGGPESMEAYSTKWLAPSISDRSRLPQQSGPFLDRVVDLASRAGFELGAVANLPLVVDGRASGFLFLYRSAPGRFSEASLRLYEILGKQTAGALRRARLYQDAQRSLEELQALNSMASAVSGSLQLEEVLQQTLEQTLSLTGYEIGLISLVNPATDQLYLALEQGLPSALSHRLTEEGMGGTLCDHVFRKGTVLSVPDFAEGAPTDVEGLLRMGLRSYLGIPLESRGAVVGTLCVFSYSPYSPEPALTRLVEGVGRQVGVAIENARLLEQARQRADRERLVSEVAASMRETLDLETVLKTAAYGIRRAMDLPAVSVRLAPSDGERPE